MKGVSNALKAQPKLCASISAWFCLPEQGMEGFEILSRASAFLVKADVNNMKNLGRSGFPVGHESTMGSKYMAKAGTEFLPSYHVITSSHVVSPWKWPKYYPDEWLQFVNEQHTHYTLEIRDQDGVFVSQVECNPVTYHHASKDLAILHLADDPEDLELLQDTGYQISELMPRSTSPGMSFLMPGKELHFIGHRVVGSTDGGDSNFPIAGASPGGGDARKPVPQTVRGQIVHKSDAQIFAKTEMVLTDGMCGGPVIVTEDANGGNGTTGGVLTPGKIVGMVEGIVPTNHSVPELQGLAVFIESDDIQDFVLDIESGGKVEPLLGGHSLDAVGSLPGDPDRFLHEYDQKSEPQDFHP